MIKNALIFIKRCDMFICFRDTTDNLFGNIKKNKNLYKTNIFTCFKKKNILIRKQK